MKNLPKDLNEVWTVLNDRKGDNMIYCNGGCSDPMAMVSTIDNPSEFPSDKRPKQLQAIMKLMQVADALNGEDGWLPDEDNFGYVIEYVLDDFDMVCVNGMQPGVIFFKSEALAQHAITLLGEETIKTACGL